MDVDPTAPARYSRALPERPIHACILTASIDLIIQRTGIMLVPLPTVLRTIGGPECFGVWGVPNPSMSPYLIWTETVGMLIEVRRAGAPSKYATIARACLRHGLAMDYERHDEHCRVSFVQERSQAIADLFVNFPRP